MAYLTREQRDAKRATKKAAVKKQMLSRPERQDLQMRMKRALTRRKAANKAAHAERTPAEREVFRLRALDKLSRAPKRGGNLRKALGVPLRRPK